MEEAGEMRPFFKGIYNLFPKMNFSSRLVSSTHEPIYNLLSKSNNPYGTRI